MKLFGAFAAIWVMTVTIGTSIGYGHPPHVPTPAVRPRIDLIGPLGNRLDPGYRRIYNRPRPRLGRINYLVAPSSREAMSWHRAEHRGDYQCERGPTVPVYEFERPWQTIPVGSRRSVVNPPEPSLLDDPAELEPSTLDQELNEPELLPTAKPEKEPDTESDPEPERSEEILPPSKTDDEMDVGDEATAKADVDAEEQPSSFSDLLKKASE